MSHTKQKLSRCAVCKIDLKGKFVFIDGQTEQLLGDSKVKLFGKSLHDFLDDNSSTILDEILNVRNNYETFYDSTILTFVSKANKSISLKVVTTLNFIAGNPVNFQLIIDTDGRFLQSTPVYTVNEKETLDLIANLDAETLSDTHLLIKYFHVLSKAESTTTYFANEKTLDMVATSESLSEEEKVAKTLSDTNPIHFDYAESGAIYSFLNEKDVSTAIEKYKKAPNEFLMPLIISDGIRCMMRMKYRENYDISELEKVFRQLLLASSIVEKVLSIQSGLSDAQDSVDLKFTIGFLETIKIPAFLTNSDGDIVGYNPVMREYFSEKLLCGSYYNLFKSISKHNRKSILDSISDYVNSPFEQSQPTEKQFSVSLTKSILKNMTVLKIGDKETDRSACFVFTPKPIVHK